MIAAPPHLLPVVLLMRMRTRVRWTGLDASHAESLLSPGAVWSFGDFSSAILFSEVCEVEGRVSPLQVTFPSSGLVSVTRASCFPLRVTWPGPLRSLPSGP